MNLKLRNYLFCVALGVVSGAVANERKYIDSFEVTNQFCSLSKPCYTLQEVLLDSNSVGHVVIRQTGSKDGLVETGFVVERTDKRFIVKAAALLQPATGSTAILRSPVTNISAKRNRQQHDNISMSSAALKLLSSKSRVTDSVEISQPSAIGINTTSAVSPTDPQLGLAHHLKSENPEATLECSWTRLVTPEAQITPDNLKKLKIDFDREYNRLEKCFSEKELRSRSEQIDVAHTPPLTSSVWQRLASTSERRVTCETLLNVKSSTKFDDLKNIQNQTQKTGTSADIFHSLVTSKKPSSVIGWSAFQTTDDFGLTAFLLPAPTVCSNPSQHKSYSLKKTLFDRTFSNSQTIRSIAATSSEDELFIATSQQIRTPSELLSESFFWFIRTNADEVLFNTLEEASALRQETRNASFRMPGFIEQMKYDTRGWWIIVASPDPALSSSSHLSRQIHVLYERQRVENKMP